MHLYMSAAEVEVVQLGQRVGQLGQRVALLEQRWQWPDLQSLQSSLHWEWWPRCESLQLDYDVCLQHREHRQ